MYFSVKENFLLKTVMSYQVLRWDSVGHVLFAWHTIICKVLSWALPHWIRTAPSDATGWMVGQRDSVTHSGLYRAAKARSPAFPSHVPFHCVLCWETAPGTKFLHGHLWAGSPQF